MRVGIYTPYLDTVGGGERYMFTIAEYFLSKGDSVDFFWDKQLDLDKVKKFFDIDLANLRVIPNIFTKGNLLGKLQATRQYDLIFFLSDGSIPLSFAKKTIVHIQRPFSLPDQKNIVNRVKWMFIKKVICNSEFTKQFVDKTYGIKSVVLYPAVDLMTRGKKEKSILSVGRFFSPSHPKKQEILVKTFKELCDSGLKGWKLTIAGSVFSGSEQDVEQLKKEAKGYPISILTDEPFNKIKDLYAKAIVYWHATGYGEDITINPDRAEHFGITTVEAMSAGAVPIVFAAGGQKEIVDDKVNGYLWENTDQLKDLTLNLIKNDSERSQLATHAVEKAKEFSKEKFFARLGHIVNE